MIVTKCIAVAAGGTGGHLFPAQALAEELFARHYAVHLITDERVRDYGSSFPAVATHVVEAATLTPGKPWRLPGQAFKILGAYQKSNILLRKIRPQAVVGFGGYPSLMPLLAATSLKIPTIVHEQNAVLGRANAFLSRRVSVVAGSFERVQGLSAEASRKFVVTGNPIRNVAMQATGRAYPPIGEAIRLVIFGGSQGARFFSEFMPGVFAVIDESLRSKLHVTQQCRQEDLDEVRKKYLPLGFRFDIAPFFKDLPSTIASAHLVISRAGASTIAELGAIGRPALLVPLPHALDNDQLRNAESFAAAGGGWVCPQSSLVKEAFAAQLSDLLWDRRKLETAAAMALSHGRPNAAKLLADVVESTAFALPHSV